MTKGRLEAFSDGVIAILITIMVLELPPPHEATLGGDGKGKLSVVLYVAAIPLAFVRPWLAQACFVVVALMWLVPDRRIERTLTASHAE